MDTDIFDSPITQPTAWSNQSLGAEVGRVMLSDACTSEIVELAKLLSGNPLPTTCLQPADFDLPQCRAAMAEAKAELEAGLGFVLIDRLPLAHMTQQAALGVYWLMAAMIGRAVAQKWDGRMIYGVADLSGKPPGDGIRADVTNAEQNFHTDNSYNLSPPEHVALLCLQPAKAGGISRVASLHAAHNEMLARHRELLGRLYRPFTFDRQREHAPDDIKIIERPVFQVTNGSLTGRLSGQLIRQGHDLASTALDTEGTDALAALYDILDDKARYREFFFEPGQIQIIDNRCLAHKRTGFEDWPDPPRKRHLTRLWLRNEGRVFYNG